MTPATKLNVAKIEKQLRLFINKHKKSFDSMVRRESALLEMGALVMTSEHYRLAGYKVEVQNDRGGLFCAKLSARGHPYNFSWFNCTRADASFEIHSNLPVAGAHEDESVYVVDVAVVRPNVVSKAKPRDEWICVKNSDLITFAEVKKLVVYPMLLAQFVGIVHEIKPKHLFGSVYGFKKYDHFPPALISLGYLKGTSAKILDGFHKRKYKVSVVHNFNMHLSTMRSGAAQGSPFVMQRMVI